MLKAAFHEGARAASKQFGVREASIAQWLAGMALPYATSAGMKVLAPGLRPALEQSFEVPFRSLKSVGQSALRAVRGPSTPADVLTRGLAGAPAQGALHELPAIIGRGAR